MKFIHNYDYKNNFFYFYYLNINNNIDDEDVNNFSFNSKFFKNFFFFRKTNKGVKNNVKLQSFQRNKNFDLNNLLINSWVKKGKKLLFLKHYNIFLNYFWYLINTNNNYFLSYPNTQFIYDLLILKKYNYKLHNLLKNPLEMLEHMFELKLKKLNKKMKKKHKKKYIYTIKYLHKPKRLKNVLNMFYSSSNFYNNKKYYDRIFFTFLNIIFNTKNSPIWEKKLSTYKIALKFLKKK